MSDKSRGKERADNPTTVPLLFKKKTVHAQSIPSSSSIPTSDPFIPLPSSSIPQRHRPQVTAPRILAVEIPPSALRPLAFRVFTKKHNLTLKSDALALLCSFIGRKCGADWRDSGSGEKLLDEIARTWKRNEGPSGILVDGGDSLKAILKGLDVPHGGGAGGVGMGLLKRQQSFDLNKGLPSSLDQGEDTTMGEGGTQDSLSTQELAIEGLDPRRYLKVVNAFSQPRYVYNPLKKRYERGPNPSLLPGPQSKTLLFKQRFSILHQRLLRNESFLPPTFSAATRRTASSSQTYYKITPIANLLGRSNQSFLLFGMLTISPAGILTLTDPTGSINLDLSLATAVPHDGAFFTPGCFLIVDGTYEEETNKFTAFTIGQPPCERREASAESFGHVDFLGTGVTLDINSAQNKAMKKIERALEDVKFIFISEVELDVPRTFDALRRVFDEYTNEPPLVCVLMGNFIRIPFGGTTTGWGGGGGGLYSGAGNGTQGSIAYKEYFDSLASLLTDYPNLTKETTFIFVPGDNDPFAAAFAGGRAGILPREAIPEVFVGRVKRVLSTANPTTTTVAAAADNSNKEARDPNTSHGLTRGGCWTSNPCKLTYFSQEITICRDNFGERLSRHNLRFKKTGGLGVDGSEVDREEGAALREQEEGDEEMKDVAPIPHSSQQGNDTEVAPDVKAARKLVKTLLDQAYLSPHPLTTRPVLWDFAHTLKLYPLPTSIILADPSSPPFTVTYEGCHVMNPGRLVDKSGWGKKARWIEFRPNVGRGRVKEEMF